MINILFDFSKNEFYYLIYQSDGDLIITTNDTNDITFSGNKQAVISLAR